MCPDTFSTHNQPSAASFFGRKTNGIAELYNPYDGSTLIRPIRKSGLKWLCEIIDTGQQV